MSVHDVRVSTVLAGLLAALPWATLASCSRAEGPPGDTIVLLAARSFAESDRAATLLDELAAATDVLGPVRFEVLAAPQARPQDLADVLGDWQAVPVGEPRRPRAVIALLGDLSALQDVDPSIPNRAPVTLTSRVVDYAALDAAVEQLARRAEQDGGRLVLVSAPLGRQGRIEVPELLAVAGHFAGRPGFIDLAAALRPLERERLWTNGIDRLDSSGQVALARALFASLCEDPGPSPPRTPEESRARAQARALSHLARGRVAEAVEAQAAARTVPLPESLSDDGDARAALRDAALVLALDGPTAAAGLWPRLEAAPPTPGRALAGRLITQQAGGPPPVEPFEAGLVAVLDAVRARDPQAARLAKALVAEHDDRIEAWMLLELAGYVASPPTEVRYEAREQLSRVPHSVVTFEAADALLDDWPRCLNSLPALYLAAQPFASLQSTTR